MSTITRTYGPKRTRAQVKMLQVLYKHGPVRASELEKLIQPTHMFNFKRTLNNLYKFKYINLNPEHQYMVTSLAMREWADVFATVERAASKPTGVTPTVNASAKFKSFEELKEAVIAAPAPAQEQVPGGVDLGVEAVEAEIRSRIEAEVRDKYRKAARSKVRLPFTIGGKTTTAYTIDEGLAACTAYMQSVNDFLSDI